MTIFTSTPVSPIYVLEGQNLTLRWTYTLDGTVGFAQFFNASCSGPNAAIGRIFGPGIITMEPKYQGRFTGHVTNTRAELTILSAQRSDQSTYKISVFPTGSGSLVHQVDVFVQCKCCLVLPCVTFA